MVDYGLAIKRPFTDLKKLLIGVGLNIVVTLLVLVPLVGWIAALLIEFVVIGFMLMCGGTMLQNKKALPEWKKPADLFKLGLMSGIILMLYLIPALVIALVVGGLAFFSGIASGGTLLSVMGSAGLGFTIWVIVIVLTFYVLPVALLLYVERENFSDAFQFKKVFKKAFTGTYFVPWLVGLIYIFAVAFVAGLLQLATLLTLVLPVIISGLVTFMLGVTVFTLLGEAVSEMK